MTQVMEATTKLSGAGHWRSESLYSATSPVVIFTVDFAKLKRFAVVSETTEDLSWAQTSAFYAKMDKAFQSISDSSLTSFDTIDELIDYIDDQIEEAKEES